MKQQPTFTMARSRSRWRRSTVIVVGMAAVCVVMLLFQRYLLYKRLHPNLPLSQLGNAHSKLAKSHEKCYGASLDTTSKDGSLKHRGSKLILMHSFPSFYQLNPDSNVFESCEYPCSLSVDEQQVSVADCVVFYTHHSKLHTPPLRCLGSVWIFFAVESPINSYSKVFSQRAWRNQFNWTMTYRRDSDVYFGYGNFSWEPSNTPKIEMDGIFAGKTKLAAWFASNCKTQSKREDFVSALKRFVDVDVFGQCGQFKCEREDDQSCMDMLSRDFFFYLSFENSLCADYVTEKLYHVMKMADVVPVVMGGADYANVLPKDSYIDVSDFPSVEALAEYLKLLTDDEPAYLSYLAWKTDWVLTEPMPMPFCEICKRVHNQHKWKRVYHDVDSWWHKGTCYDPPAITLS